MEHLHEKRMKDIFCPNCGESLIFPNSKWPTKIGDISKQKIFLTGKGGRTVDRILLFKIVRGSGVSGFLELSIEPGDYSKYVSLDLHPEEEVTFIHPHCHKAMNDKSMVRILVQYEDNTVEERFIMARYGIEVTLYKSNGEIGSYYGQNFKSLAEYMEGELKKIDSRT